MNECWTPSSKDENILRSTSSQVINSFKKGKVFLMDFWGQRRYQFSTIEFSLSMRFWVVNFFIFGHFQFFSESELQRHCHAADNRICNGIEDGRLSKYIGSKCPYFVPNPKNPASFLNPNLDCFDIKNQTQNTQIFFKRW